MTTTDLRVKFSSEEAVPYDESKMVLDNINDREIEGKYIKWLESKILINE